MCVSMSTPVSLYPESRGAGLQPAAQPNNGTIFSKYFKVCVEINVLILYKYNSLCINMNNILCKIVIINCLLNFFQEYSRRNGMIKMLKAKIPQIQKRQGH